MFLLTSHVVGQIAGKFCVVMLLLMSASLLVPGTLQAEPEKLNLSRKATNQTIDELNKAMEKAFLQLLSDHQRMILKICRLYCNSRADQQDLFQEIACQLWKAFPAFREKSKESTWLYSIALKTAMIPYRKPHARIELTGELPEVPAPEDSLHAEIFMLLQTLKPVDRGIVALMMEGYERKEIAEMVGLSEEALKKRLTRLKKKNPI